VEAIFFRFFHPSPQRGRRFLLLACIAGAAIPLIDTANARSRYPGNYENPDPRYQADPRYRPDPRYRADPHYRSDRQNSQHRAATEKKQKPEEAAQPSGPMFFVVSLGRQHVSVYSNDGLYARAPISTGMPGHPTPMGIFNILGKERLHHSNIYSGAPMPYMQRITWSGVAMHEGVLPGYPASHGCIRLPHEFAKRMFGATQGNERVIITRQDIAPAPFSHAKLPVPAFLPEPGPDNMSISARILQNAVATSDAAAEKVSIKADGGEAQPGGASQKLLNPLDYAKAMKVLAAKKAEEAAAAASPARTAIQAKAKEMQVATVDLKKAQIALNKAKSRLEAADRQLQKATGDALVSAANAAKAEAEAKVKEAEAQVETVQRAKAQKDNEWAAALKVYKDLDNVQRSAAEGAKIWGRRLAPVSVFISRKTQRLYVRQNFLKVFDVPVTIRDPEKPLGTHLYMAMPPAKNSAADGPGLRWLVLTLPEASADTDRSRRRRSRYYDDDDDTPRVPAPTISASTALDRIEIPVEVAGKISEMLWTGGSLIVSDSGISRETDDYSDFIILTR
jgi:lipoprotein-anchoring transpeptidase ErfK/SrfK